MGKYEVNYKCQHKTQIQLFGKYAERKSRIAYLESVDCPECAAAKHAEKFGLELAEMHYRDYKNSGLEAAKDTYNEDTKTIKVFIAQGCMTKQDAIRAARKELTTIGANENDIVDYIKSGWSKTEQKLFYAENAAITDEDRAKVSEIEKAYTILKKYYI